ncbi:MAG: hypothetical protein WBB25_18915 [Sulfitobacter sp.]
MIELLFVTCLAGDPEQCQHRSMLFTDVSVNQCLMGAQPELAKWSATHPREQIQSWQCRTVSFAERDA